MYTCIKKSCTLVEFVLHVIGIIQKLVQVTTEVELRFPLAALQPQGVPSLKVVVSDPSVPESLGLTISPPSLVINRDNYNPYKWPYKWITGVKKNL